MVQKDLGEPQVVCFIVWEMFMSPSKELSVGGSHGDMPGHISRTYKDRMTAPFVTTLDTATGKLDRTEFPNYFREESCKKNWTRLFAQLHARMKKRNLEDAMMLGWFTDVPAQKEELVYWKDVSGNLPWVSHRAFHGQACCRAGHQGGLQYEHP